MIACGAIHLAATVETVGQRTRFAGGGGTAGTAGIVAFTGAVLETSLLAGASCAGGISEVAARAGALLGRIPSSEACLAAGLRMFTCTASQDYISHCMCYLDKTFSLETCSKDVGALIGLCGGEAPSNLVLKAPGPNSRAISSCPISVQ